MADPKLDEHYEEKFEFPLLKLIRQRAEEKDISYSQAYKEVQSEYGKNIRYRDTAFEDQELERRQREMIALREKRRREGKV
jgi:hypothetical protein